MTIDVQALSAEFNMPFSACDLIYEGSDNNIYCLKDIQGTKYILREALRQKAPEDLAFETHFSQFLFENKIPVRLILKAGARSLLSFCEGKALDFDEVTLPQCWNGGRTLAQFHLISKQFNQPPLPKRQQDSELKRVAPIAEKLSALFVDGAAFVDNVQQILASPYLTQANDCIIHNDFRIQNVLFEGENLSAILDFDWACVGNSMKDLAHALTEWSILDGKPILEDRFRAFLEGYRSVIPHIDDEALQFWICFACLSDAATYLADRLDDFESGGRIRSWMYGKYKFFKENNVCNFIKKG